MAVDDQPWTQTFGDYVTDAQFSPDGSRVACIGVEKERHHIVVDGSTWEGSFDMAWAPIFSPDSQHAAAKIEKDGLYTLLVDGKPLKSTYKAVWEPIFSPDSQSVLIRAIEGSGADAVYTRTVMPLTEILG
jgi:Tol biopolymer transport system component